MSIQSVKDTYRDRMCVCAFIEDECARFVSTFFSKKKTLTLKKLIFNLIFYILLYIYSSKIIP